MDGNLPLVRHQRACGALRIDVRRGGDRTRLADLRQEGCLKARFPREQAAALQAVLLNTAGGITDGDVLQTHLAVRDGASLTVSTVAAERIYRARPGGAPACVTVNVAVGANARAEYLPQETILFDHASMRRALRIEMDGTGSYLGCETLVFGRAASGEILHALDLHDTVEIRRAGTLVFRDCVALHGDATHLLAGPATSRGAAAVASLVYAAPDAAAKLERLRKALVQDGVAAGASFRDGLITARIVAPTANAVRRALADGLAALRNDAPMPRVWLC